MAEKSKKQPPKKSKVMDVSKPGKSAPSASSRPIILGHKPPVQDSMVNEDKEMPSGDSEEHKIDVKRTGQKVIAPLSSADSLVAAKEAEMAENAPTPDYSDEDKPEVNAAPEDEVLPGGTAEPETPDESVNETPVEEPVNKPSKESKDNKDSKDKGSSIVDAVAGQAAKNKDKKDDKKNEELEKRLAEIEKLVDEKKYFVPTSSTTKKERKTRWAALFLAILLLAAGYLVIDAQLIKNDLWLPYEFFKEKQVEQSEPIAIEKDATEENSEKAAPAQEKEVTEAEEEASAQVKARDSERKNELKSLQQKLETYYNDNGSYPATLADLTPLPTADEVTGPKDDKYVYVPAADNSSYTLTAKLENAQDPDADTDGNYVVRSVNQ